MNEETPLQSPASETPPAAEAPAESLAAPETLERRSFVDYLTDPRARRIEWLFAMLLVCVGIFALVVTRGDLVAQSVLEPTAPEEAAAAAAAAMRDLPERPYRLVDLDLHPDQRYPRYFSGSYFTDGQAGGNRASALSALEDFQTQLAIYQRRAGEDDNFSIRVYDNRTWQTLEVFTLRDERERFRQNGRADWERVNALRRVAANQLTTKWVGRGVPRDAISMRWGYADQMREARERKAPFIEHEIRYARQLGLSLLTTEIGTVETFNQDWLVSPAGARGRYQFMPDNLALFGVRSYDLPAASGTVTVREELHPLIMLQAAFLLVRGYSNAVGHEIPGVSAYHTGPGNIFHLYQTFLRAKSNDATVRNATVSEAYMWGVTEGFARVRQQSSFGPHSRGYVLSAYGALRALDEHPVDPTRTLWTEQVQLSDGQQIAVAELLDLIAPHGGRVDWGAGIDDASLYERFRALNPHMSLPASAENGGVPAAGNVRLRATAGNNFPVRFYLPYGATELLERIRPGLLNAARTIRFDDNAFADPAVTGEKTQHDYNYEQLVLEIGQFNFSNAHRNRLEGLYRRFVAMAEEDPTPYRMAQLRVITIHRRIWQTRAFNDLAGTVQNVLAGRGADETAG